MSKMMWGRVLDIQCSWIYLINQVITIIIKEVKSAEFTLVYWVIVIFGIKTSLFFGRNAQAIWVPRVQWNFTGVQFMATHLVAGSNEQLTLAGSNDIALYRVRAVNLSPLEINSCVNLQITTEFQNWICL